MSRSDFCCRSCGELLGRVRPTRLLQPQPGVAVRHFLDAGYAVLTCPGCGQERTYRGGVIETTQASRRTVLT